MEVSCINSYSVCDFICWIKFILDQIGLALLTNGLEIKVLNFENCLNFIAARVFLSTGTKIADEHMNKTKIEFVNNIFSVQSNSA